MSVVDQIIKQLIIEKVENCQDAELLDLVHKLLLAEGS